MCTRSIKDVYGEVKTLKRKNVMRDENGFTLIEIISVLLILGALAANATPKLADLTTYAREKAAVAAIAVVKARCSLTYAKQLLLANGDTTAITAATIIAAAGVTTNPDVGTDFVVQTSVRGNDILITVSQVQGKEISANNTYTWEIPPQDFSQLPPLKGSKHVDKLNSNDKPQKISHAVIQSRPISESHNGKK
jgi:prepilin-type N-terminal cleavage/methylation domain-containing protein